MKRVLIILTAFLMASCARIRQQAVVVPSATPEMLIVRPTREIPTAIVPEIAYTLTAANIPKAIQTVTPKPFEPVVIGNMMLEYLGCQVTEFLGDKCIEISYRFTNNSAETAHFGGSFSTSAFQDGIELKLHIADNSEISTDVRPGRSIVVKDAFYLRSNSPVIELEFYPFLRIWSQPVTRTITIK